MYNKKTMNHTIRVSDNAANGIQPSRTYVCLRMTECGQDGIDDLKNSTIASYEQQKTKPRLNRFLEVVGNARHRGPVRADVSMLRGPPTVSTHLVHSYGDPSGLNMEEDNTPVVFVDKVIHGVKGLLAARRRKRKFVLVYRLCSCGVCVTYNDIKYHCSLLVLASLMTLSERMPRDFMEYVKSREMETMAMLRRRRIEDDEGNNAEHKKKRGGRVVCAVTNQGD